MRYLYCLVFFVASYSIARAQIPDQEQRMHWFYLQKLAKDVRELEACTILESPDIKMSNVYYKKTDELGVAIENYVTRYSSTRPKHETIPAFRYRVWHVAMIAGDQDARPLKEMTVGICDIFKITN